MTGLKRLLLIIFSLHNIKHHIISQEGEGRAIVELVHQTGRNGSDLKTFGSLSGISWFEAEPPTMTMWTIRPFIHEHRVLFHRSSHQTNNFPSSSERAELSAPPPSPGLPLVASGSQVRTRANINTWAVIVYGPQPPLTCGQPPGTDMSLSVWPSSVVTILWSLIITSNIWQRFHILVSSVLLLRVAMWPPLCTKHTIWF